MPAVCNVMTVDVEDYFHVSAFDGLIPRQRWAGFDRRVERNTDRLLALFGAARVTATFFVLGWVAERCGSLVRRIAAAGHEIASHGYAHRLVYDQTPAAFRDDVRRSKRLLEDVTGVSVRAYRAPSYSVTPRSLWALDVLIEEGYQYDASIFPIRHDRYGIPLSARHPYVLQRPAGRIVEVPASTVACAGVNLPVAGGGYFRLLPYAWTRWGIARVNRRERRPVVFYLHPWEIDPAQPQLPSGRLTRYRHYHNLDRTEARLEALLADFTFGPLHRVFGANVPEPGGSAALPYLW